MQTVCGRGRAVLDDEGLQGVFNRVVVSGGQVGKPMIIDQRLPLISARGSAAAAPGASSSNG